jgi:hypothetical protein
MTLNQRTDYRGKCNHDTGNEYDRGDHDGELIDHACGGDNGVERKYNIEQQNLYDYAGEGGRERSRTVRFSRFKFAMDFKSALT